MVPKINIIQAKSIFIKSGLPGSDDVINPYNGCLFGCMYCYAAQIARWKHPNEVWGTYLDVKINASELLKKELMNLEKRLKAHNELKSGAHYTKIRRPVKLVYSEILKSFGRAREREAEIKRLSKQEKIKLIKQNKNLK